jgi:hypothetical protein
MNVSSYGTLYEYETTLAAAVAKLRLSVLTESQEEEIRTLLSRCFAETADIDRSYRGRGSRSVGSLASQRLSSFTRHLEQIAPVLAAGSQGIHESHHIEVLNHIAESLSGELTVESVIDARKRLIEFGIQATLIADAARKAALLAKAERGARNRPRQEWVVHFKAALLKICEWNGIIPTLGIDRNTGAPTGELLRIAQGFEKLLPPDMRAPSAKALLKRLQRSKSRPRRE